MGDNASIGTLLRAETTRRRYWPGVRVREEKNSQVEVSFVGDVVTMNGSTAQALWEWLRLQPDELTEAELMAHADDSPGRKTDPSLGRWKVRTLRVYGAHSRH